MDRRTLLKAFGAAPLAGILPYSVTKAEATISTRSGAMIGSLWNDTENGRLYRLHATQQGPRWLLEFVYA